MKPVSWLDRLLNPLTEALSPEVARRLVELRAPAEVQARADELASKANAGTLTATEELEYKQVVDAVDIVSIMQAKAQRFLARHAAGER